jgi:hypothetical protein
MAATVISDLVATIDKRLLSDFVVENLKYQSNLAQAGVVVFDNAIASQGGTVVTLPRYNPIDADSSELERMTDSSSLTENNVSSYIEQAPLLHYGKAWAARDLATLANTGQRGNETLEAIVSPQIVQYFANGMEKMLGYHLEGVFKTAASANVVGDGSASFSLEAIVDGRSKLGEAQATQRGILVVDSIIYAQIQKLGIATTVESQAFFEDWYRGGTIQVVGETPIIINDKICRTLSSGVSSAYLFFGAPLVMGYQETLLVEPYRDELKKQSGIAADVHWFSHLSGTSYNTAGGSNPTSTTLALATTWTLAAEHIQNVPAVQLKFSQTIS